MSQNIVNLSLTYFLRKISNMFERLVTQKYKELFIIPKQNHAECRNAIYTIPINVFNVKTTNHFASVEENQSRESR